MEARANDYAHVDKPLYSLVDGSPAHSAFCCHILERQSGIGRDDAQNLFVKTIYLFHIYFVNDVSDS